MHSSGAPPTTRGHMAAAWDPAPSPDSGRGGCPGASRYPFVPLSSVSSVQVVFLVAPAVPPPAYWVGVPQPPASPESSSLPAAAGPVASAPVSAAQAAQARPQASWACLMDRVAATQKQRGRRASRRLRLGPSPRQTCRCRKGHCCQLWVRCPPSLRVASVTLSVTETENSEYGGK